MILKILHAWAKKNEMKKYGVGLRGALAKDHGSSSYYSADQVEKTLERKRLKTDDAVFAFCMYCTASDFASYSSQHAFGWDYNEVKQDIADALFSGNINYTQDDVMTLTTIGAQSDLSDTGFDGGGGGGAD